MFSRITLAIVAAFLSPVAVAYIGPGMGLGTLAVVFGVIASVLLAIVAMVWYPLKKLFRRVRSRPAEDIPEEDAGSKEEPSPANEMEVSKKDPGNG